MRLTWMAAGAAGMALGLLAAPAAGAPSFDCSAASTPVERAICADPALADLDQRIADAYGELLGLDDEAGRARGRADQKAWITTVRNGCARHPAPAACLNGVMEDRARRLEAAVAPARQELARVVHGLADAPAEAARSLAGRRGPLARAWLAYALRYGPRPDPAAADATLSDAIDAAGDSFAVQIAADQNLATDDGFLTALRLVNDVFDMAVPCFVVTRHGAAGWAAVDAIYGSSADGATPMPDCPATPGLFDAPSWQAVEALLDPMLSTAYGRTGTYRSAIGRSLEVARMRAAIAPAGFRDDGAFATAAAAIQSWTNPYWVGAAWPERFGAAMQEALRAWEAVLASRHGMTALDAAAAARGAAAAYLGTAVPFIEEHLELTADTRVPAWLHGRWAWTGGPAELPPFSRFPIRRPDGRLSITADRLCADGDGECLPLEAAGGEDAAAAAQSAARTARPPVSPAQPPQAVHLAVEGSLDGDAVALRLSDGSVLISDGESLSVRLTPAK